MFGELINNNNNNNNNRNMSHLNITPQEGLNYPYAGYLFVFGIAVSFGIL
jgi:hypothetical protein